MKPHFAPDLKDDMPKKPFMLRCWNCDVRVDLTESERPVVNPKIEQRLIKQIFNNHQISKIKKVANKNDLPYDTAFRLAINLGLKELIKTKTTTKKINKVVVGASE